MPPVTDSDQTLLLRYAQTRDEVAFAEVVERHLNLVYSTAKRVVQGDTALAEDVTQKVFADLAGQAAVAARATSVGGWLHTCTRFAALSAIRGESRRRAREQEATLMNEPSRIPETDWEQLRPLLDEAVGRLRPRDRDVVVMRFFEGKSHREVAEALGLNENAARMRVKRALEKLRKCFVRRGMAMSGVAVAEMISANSVQAAPAGLGAKVVGSSLASAAAVGAGHWAWSIFLMSTRQKIAIAIIAFATLTAIPLAISLWLASPAETKVPLRTGLQNTVAAPGAAPVAPTQSMDLPTAPAPAKPLTVAWVLNGYAASKDWVDAGADTPENALQTLYWARMTGNHERDDQLRIQKPVVMTPAQQRSFTRGTPAEATVNDSPREYQRLKGAQIIRRKQTSPGVVEMNVNEDWEGADDQIQEWFLFHLVDGQWRYTQTLEVP